MNINYFINVSKYLHYFFSYKIVSVQLMTHIFVPAYHLINKFSLLEEKIHRHNIMAAYSFDIQFMFVWAGIEGSAHDTCIFLKAIDSSSIKFPKLPEGCDFI